jgi:hypothetical protein
MRSFFVRPTLLLAFVVCGAAAIAACGGSSNTSTPGDDAGDASDDTSLTPPDTAGDDTGFVIDGSTADVPSVFDVQPTAMQVISVSMGATMPTVAFSATLDGQPVNAAWSVDRGDVGTIAAGPSSSGVFTPSGKTGGLVTISAGLNGQTLTRKVFVKLGGQSNGVSSDPSEQGQVPANAAALTAGGGVGGVGGEGLGPALTDAPTKSALASPSGNGTAQGLKFLYPYDKTVWPRGMLAPLLMWDWAGGDADAIQIQLSTASGSFSWTGTYARPAILGATGKFVRHPIPQDVWQAATDTAGGPTPNGQKDTLTVSLTVAHGGQAYGPISETWIVAPGRVSGTIYYNSYGTQLVQNYSGSVGGNGRFGAASLSIRVGDTAPKVTAGTNSPVGDSRGCRVCHSVAANGSRVLVEQWNSAATSAYDVATTGITEHPMVHDATFPAVYPDGSMTLTGGGLLLPLPTDTTPIPTTGLTSVVTDLGSPMFSPDGKMIAFNPMAGSLASLAQSIYVMGFDKGTNGFSGPKLIALETAPSRPGWPAFFPDSKSVVYEAQSTGGNEGNGIGQMHTRRGAKGQIRWTDLNDPMNATTLDALNGKGYLPKLATPSSLACTADGTTVGNIDPDHGDDVDLNYEPTVNPVASGGYAWVVFTSRRMYGNEAVIPPFCSDPRGVNLIQNITTKKLWVAAVDLSQAPGTDASHPAFYLPAQELLAGNSRGFWALEPCRQDGNSCQSGDQCCNGYCEPDSSGALVCSNTPPVSQCSKLAEKCTTAADCCDPTNVCVNGFCSLKGPQ